MKAKMVLTTMAVTALGASAVLPIRAQAEQWAPTNIQAKIAGMKATAAKAAGANPVKAVPVAETKSNEAFDLADQYQKEAEKLSQEAAAENYAGPRAEALGKLAANLSAKASVLRTGGVGSLIGAPQREKIQTGYLACICMNQDELHILIGMYRTTDGSINRREIMNFNMSDDRSEIAACENVLAQLRSQNACPKGPKSDGN